jgi:uncharacterized protein (TIGR02996 family)
MVRSQADVFLEAILENPDDDTPRLIYADWLEERGDLASAARAEFIRVQCALTKRHPPDPRHALLKQREEELIDQNSWIWARPIRRLVRCWTFRRGFIEEVTMEPSQFCACADRLFRRAPIRHMYFYLTRAVSGLQIDMPSLADCEQLRHLLSLDFARTHLDSHALRALIVSKHLTSLNTLNLAHNRIGNGGIRLLAESPLLGQLTHLDLRRNDFGPTGVRALATALVRLNRSAEGLRMGKVELSNKNLGTSGRRLIASSPILRRIVVVHD